MNLNTMTKENRIKCVVAELTPAEYFAIQTAVNVALTATFLPEEDRNILEKLKGIKPTVKEVVEG